MKKKSENEYDKLVTDDFLKRHSNRLENYTRESYERMLSEKDHLISEMGEEVYNIILNHYEEVINLKKGNHG